MKFKEEKVVLLLLTLIITLYSIVSFSHLGTQNFPETYHKFNVEEELVLDLKKETYVSFINICNGYNILNYDIYTSNDGINYNFLTNKETEYFYSWEKIPLETSTAFIKIKFKQYQELPAQYKKNIYDGDIAYINEIGIFNKDNEKIDFLSPHKELSDEQNTVPLTKTPVNSLYFDEFYFAKAGYQYNNNIIDGEIDQPPLGKELISIGIKCFGMNPFGWRFPGTLAGVFMLGFIFLLTKELFKSSKLGLLATIILSLDFMHFSQTRLATIDSFAILSIIMCFYFLIKIFNSKNYMIHTFLCGIMLGIGCAIKIYCAYAIPVIGLLLLYKTYSIYKESITDAIQFILGCILAFVFIPIIINILTFIPHFILLKVSNPIKYMFSFYKNMFTFHSTTISEHPFSSMWWQWLFNYKPMFYYGTETNQIYSIIACFNNPLISIVGLFSIFYTTYNAFKYNNFSGKIIVFGYFSFLIPWIFITRSTFIYHYFASSIFMILAIIYMFNELKNKVNKKTYYIIIFTFVNLMTILFVLYYPILTGINFDIEYAKSFFVFYPFLNF